MFPGILTGIKKKIARAFGLLWHFFQIFENNVFTTCTRSRRVFKKIQKRYDWFNLGKQAMHANVVFFKTKIGHKSAILEFFKISNPRPLFPVDTQLWPPISRKSSKPFLRSRLGRTESWTNVPGDSDWNQKKNRESLRPPVSFFPFFFDWKQRVYYVYT